jgi:uncharacterized protein YcbK (DUF882 family)
MALVGLSGSSWAKTVRKHVAAGVHSAKTHTVALHGKKPLRSGLGNRPSRFASSKPVASIHGEDVVPGEMPVDTAALEAAPNQVAPVEIASNQPETAPVMPAATETAPVTVSKVDGKPYTLRMSNLHTGETLEIVYRIGNTYIPDALAKLNYFLRDHNTQDVVDYSPKEFDVLHAMMSRLGKVNGLIDIVCGYRTPETNEALRHDSPWTGVAEHSQHMEGHAIDLRVPGVSTAALRNAALSLKAGGVGYYPISQFVHIDVGPVREWVHGGRTQVARRRTRRSRVSNGM